MKFEIVKLYFHGVQEIVKYIVAPPLRVCKILCISKKASFFYPAETTLFFPSPLAR